MGDDYTGLLYPAHKDIRAIEALSDDIDEHCEVIAFHAQQAAEKILKNVFEENGRVPPKIHDIDDLLGRAIDSGWIEATTEEVRAAASLSKFAVVIRYDCTPDIGRGEALHAINACNRLSDMIERAGYPAIKINVRAELLHDQPDRLDRQMSVTQNVKECRAASEELEGHGHAQPPKTRDER